MDRRRRTYDHQEQAPTGRNQSDKILPKRFYKDADIILSLQGLHQITLDGKKIKTPGGAPMILPTSKIANAVLKEWRSQSEFINPETMPVTKLCHRAIDHIRKDRAAIVDKVVAYAETDLICYFAEAPDELVRQQTVNWNGIHNWAKEELKIELNTGSGILHIAQSETNIKRISNLISRFDEFRLAAVYAMVTLSGSFLIPLAFVYGHKCSDECWRAAQLDEDWQNSRWGVDAEALERNIKRRQEFELSCRFIEGLGTMSDERPAA